MFPRLAALQVVVVVLLFLVPAAFGAGAVPVPPPPGETAKPQESPKPAAAPTPAAPGADLAPILTQLEQIRKELKAGQAAAVSRQEFNDLAQRVYDLETAVGEIARKQPAAGGTVRYILDVNKSAADPTFRQDLSQVVRNSLPQRGTLRINNEMATDQDLLINGVQYRVLARTVRDFDVPAGTVTTQLPGFESPKNWTIASPGFFQQVNITPRIVTPIIESLPLYPPIVSVY